MAQKSNLGWTAGAVVAIALAICVPLLTRGRDDDRTVVLYCAHDSIFAEDIIRRFETQTGIRVDVRFDEEASKSLGLTNLLISEKANPRCDVFWNNQTLGTIRLQREGILVPWKSAAFNRIPIQFKDPDGHWTGFAARMRVFVVNVERMPATEEAIRDYLAGDSLTEAAIAVPLYGTTLTQYAVMSAETGFEELQQWHVSLRSRGIHEARGNGAVKDLVADGVCRVGFTDTDDVFVAIKQGKPVAMQPVRLPSGGTIVIPNSVSMIRGCPHPENAQKLIDYLLSEEVELLLANSDSHQIPLGPVDESKVPEAVRELQQWALQGVDQTPAIEHDRRVLDWLSREYLPE